MEQSHLLGQFRSCDTEQRDEVKRWGDWRYKDTRWLSEAAAKEPDILLKIKQSTPFSTYVYSRKQEPDRPAEEVDGHFYGYEVKGKLPNAVNRTSATVLKLGHSGVAALRRAAWTEYE